MTLPSIESTELSVFEKVDLGLIPRSGQTKDYKNWYLHFPAGRSVRLPLRRGDKRTDGSLSSTLQPQSLRCPLAK